MTRNVFRQPMVPGSCRQRRGGNCRLPSPRERCAKKFGYSDTRHSTSDRGIPFQSPQRASTTWNSRLFSQTMRISEWLHHSLFSVGKFGNWLENDRGHSGPVWVPARWYQRAQNYTFTIMSYPRIYKRNFVQHAGTKIWRRKVMSNAVRRKKRVCLPWALFVPYELTQIRDTPWSIDLFLY